MDPRVVSVSVSGESLDHSSSLLVIPSNDLCSRRSEDWYPVYFGVSCAFFALRLVSDQGCSSQEEGNEGRLTEVCDKILRGSAQLLGVLVWKSQKVGSEGEKREIQRKLEAAERALEDLRRVRREDAKANEKVVGIFAAQEQRWLCERRRLQQQVGSLVNDIRVLMKEKDMVVSKLNGKIKELEDSVQSKEKLLEVERGKVAGLEEKLREGEIVVEELQERAKREAQENSSKIWKHKTAFIELVSNQRRIEAELDRALRQVEATKQEFGSVFAQKEESASMVRKLSSELVKMQKDAEQKDKVLSAMLRKSRLDVEEKQMLIKEVKTSKSKKKQSDFEAERFKFMPESKDVVNSLFRNSLKLPNSSRSQRAKNSRSQSNSLLEYDNQDSTEEIGRYSAMYDRCSPEDYKRLDNWAQLEAEKYGKAIDQQHRLEIDAFIEQMRIKDEKLEEFRWRLLSMEIESKRLNSHVETLTKEISQRRLDNTKLEAALISRAEELDVLKERLTSHLNQATKHWQEAEETEAVRFGEICLEEEAESLESPSTSQQSEFRAVQSHERESEEDKEVDSHSIMIVEVRETPATNISKVEQLPCPSQLSRNPPWKMDLQALGVFYKIKRLKQQLLMLERLIGKQESGHDADSSNERLLGAKNMLALISILNKQVGRYHSLQERTDDLCKRKHDKDLNATQGDSNLLRTKELEVFLEETFQLQRYMVATGQKMMEIQSKVANGFLGAAEQVDKFINIDMKRFCDGLRTLFRDVQGGLEVRIARIIGDLEGTLARDGMIHLR
ncbi:hypothetical protein MLD38_030445 [Melastoma candidum]|uniref:Uncharacterized protein n=1 Tax=Melastoma candidum TaxID=119954 RepID=A0ACB9MRW0_9MYRT|nr:hypothetical protein MLD38_030445 [Melastoma candidum]